MVWGVVRLAIFSTAFLIGTMVTGSGESAASGEVSAIRQWDQKAGTSLVVACNDGTVSIRKLDARGAVRLDCERSNMVVVRDHHERSEKVPEFHFLRYQMHWLIVR